MSRHGMVPPGDFPQRRGWHGRHATLLYAARALALEFLIGIAVAACTIAVQDAELGLAPFVAIATFLWGLVIFWARSFGALGPRSWPKAFIEACLLSVGAAGFATLLLAALGLRTWATL